MTPPGAYPVGGGDHLLPVPLQTWVGIAHAGPADGRDRPADGRGTSLMQPQAVTGGGPDLVLRVVRGA